MDRVHVAKHFRGNFRIRHAYTKVFFQANGEFERIDRIETDSVWSKQWRIIRDLIGRDLQHQILDHHFFDAGA